MADYDPRTGVVATEIMESIRSILIRRNVQYGEYAAFCSWIDEVIEAGEAHLFIDNFFERTIEENTYRDKLGSEGTIEGLYYVPDAPLLTETPFALPMRPDEQGEPLVLDAEVLDLEDRPIEGALVDLWHSGNDGTYSSFVGTAPKFNLRARMRTDERGRLQVRTILPAAYQIPVGGPVGRFLDKIDRHAWRPAHFHMKISAHGFESLTTQIYFEGDKWLKGDGDVSGAVKESLITELFDDDNEEVAARYGLPTPFLSVSHQFHLRPGSV
jgi:catechol 1,2-dioxygenase